MSREESCFSETNFDIVYSYLDEQIRKLDESFFTFGAYKLYIIDTTEIRVKKDGYSLVIINKERGIYSLAKVLKDNNRLVKKANQIFCEILSLNTSSPQE